LTNSTNISKADDIIAMPRLEGISIKI